MEILTLFVLGSLFWGKASMDFFSFFPFSFPQTRSKKRQKAREQRMKGERE
jgi:hypothetical protein